MLMNFSLFSGTVAIAILVLSSGTFAHIHKPYWNTGFGGGCGVFGPRNTLNCASLNDASGIQANGAAGATLYPTCSAPQLDDVVHLASGNAHFCAILNDTSAWCWGRGTEGEMGAGFSTSTNPSPVATLLTSGVAHIDAYEYTMCAVMQDGTGRVWGHGNNGKLGTNGTANSNIPLVASLPSGTVTSCAAGSTHICFVVDGAVYWAGKNQYGQLGDGTETTSLVFIPVLAPANANVRLVEAGRHYTCAVLDNDAVYCWGRSDQGQVPDGNCVAEQHVPTALPSPLNGTVRIADFSAGQGHACVLSTTLTDLYCWGTNEYSEVTLDGSTSTKECSPVETAFSGGFNIDYVECRLGATTIASHVNGVLVIGRNLNGGLGIGVADNSLTPISPNATFACVWEPPQPPTTTGVPTTAAATTTTVAEVTTTNQATTPAAEVTTTNQTTTTTTTVAEVTTTTVAEVTTTTDAGVTTTAGSSVTSGASATSNQAAPTTGVLTTTANNTQMVTTPVAVVVTTPVAVINATSTTSSASESTTTAEAATTTTTASVSESLSSTTTVALASRVQVSYVILTFMMLCFVLVCMC